MSKAEGNIGSNDGDPPELNVNLPSAKDVDATPKHRSAASLPVDVLLLTVKDCEFLACYRQLVNPFKCWFDEIGFVYFENTENGEKVRVALVRCSEGSVTPGGSLITVTKAVPVLRPKAVISVGTCSSLDPNIAKLGDVVVSAKMKELPTGMRNYVSRRFLKVIKHAGYGYRAPLHDAEVREIKVHCDGEFLSGPELVYSETRRKELAQCHPQALAVETEGGGVFTAAFEDQIEWLIVKGIADYADGDELTTELWRPFASVMAASVVQHILSNPYVFSTWPNYCNEDVSFGCESSRESKRGQKWKLSEHHGEDAPRVTHVIKRIREIYQRNEERLLPVPWCEDFSFHLNGIFTRLKIVGKEKTRGNLTDEITNMTAIFRAHKECEKPRVVLIEGEPGVGKTTYCQKLAYDWATKQNEWDDSFPKIEVLLLLRCRDITSDNIWEAIDDQILPDDTDEEDKEVFFQFIRENKSKVLLVIDGLDEAFPGNLAVCFKLVERRDLPDCHIVLSSCHEAGKQVRRHCDTLWEIVGFKEEDASSFIRKYFQNMEILAKKLIHKICFIPRDRDLIELTKNPLHTALLCILFEDFDGLLPTSKTQLYVEIVSCVLRRYEKKNGLSNNDDQLIAVYKKELIYLGCMAFHALRKGESYFEENERGQTATGILIKSGLLSVQLGGSRRKRFHRFRFLHRSFQEFFAGLYLAFQISDEEIDYLVTNNKYLSSMKEVFNFMSGIAASQCEENTVSVVRSLALFATLSSRASDDAKANSYLQVAFYFIEKCVTHKESLEKMLVNTLADYLEVRTIRISSFIRSINRVTDIIGTISTLTNLDVSSKNIGGKGANSLSQALWVNSALTNLILFSNSIGDEGANSLSKALRVNSTLTILNLGMNSIGDKGANSLSKALTINTTLTNLDLFSNSIGAEGANSLSQALRVNSTLTNLNLGGNSIGDEGANSLSQALTVNITLTNLILFSNSIGDKGANSFSQALTVNSTQTNLNLGMNSIGDKGANSLSKALTVNTTLTNLDLFSNSIGAEGAHSLSQALRVNSTLTNLNLGSNSIGDEGANSLSQALRVKTTLTNLDLFSNSIGAEGANCLSQALAVNSTLTNLNLGMNSIGDEGANSLSQVLRVNSTLTNLDLFGNSIGDEGANSLSHALTVNTTLTNLNLGCNSICEEGANSLSKALTVNSTLTNLDLSDNRIGDQRAN